MVIRLFRVHNHPEAVYFSSDGLIQLAIRPDHPEYKDLPLYIDVNIQFQHVTA